MEDAEKKEVEKLLKSRSRRITLKEFCDLFGGTIITAEGRQVIVSKNGIKMRINCDDE